MASRKWEKENHVDYCLMLALAGLVVSGVGTRDRGYGLVSRFCPARQEKQFYRVHFY
jgi:hypothetical protein